MNLDSNNKDKYLSIVSYFPIICLIPFIAKNKSDFVKFHSKQGIILFAFELIVFTANSLTSLIASEPLFITVNFFLTILIILSLTFIVKGIINVLNNTMTKLPLIGYIIRD